MSTKTHTVILADDHGIVRTGLRAALEQLGQQENTPINVIGEAANGLETIDLVKRMKPDLIVLDISMPMASGAEILTDLRRWSPETKIVILSAVTSPGLLSQIVSEGVEGMFPKGGNTQALFEAMPLILRGGRVIDRSIVDLIREQEPSVELTARERQTLNMVLAGKNNAEIGGIMGISARTAEKHRANMMEKLGVRSLSELMAKALQDGLIEQQSMV